MELGRHLQARRLLYIQEEPPRWRLLSLLDRSLFVVRVKCCVGKQEVGLIYGVLMEGTVEVITVGYFFQFPMI